MKHTLGHRPTTERGGPEPVQGVVGILVTAPFYGARKPAGQEAWFLRRVSDAFAQAWAVALEATALLHWARQRWRVPLAVTGVSYGAAMAALTSKLYPGPLAVVPFMGCSGPGEPFAHGKSLPSCRRGLPEQCWVVGPYHMKQFRIFRSSFWVAVLEMLQSDPTLSGRAALHSPCADHATAAGEMQANTAALALSSVQMCVCM